MIGWHISVYRQTDGGGAPASHATKEGKRLAVWQTGWDGLNWLRELAKSGKAIDLDGNGYPNRFTAQAEHVIPVILVNPPCARKSWHRDEVDSVTSEWAGKTVIDRDAARECRFDEWLLVQVWDES